MATKKRITISRNVFAQLIEEVDGLCPLCGVKLLSLKDAKGMCLAQAAHIYPHSPSDDETEVLKNEPLLTLDSESILFR